MKDFFKIKERNSSVRVEVMAGLSSFAAMAYIIFVNPDILSKAGMDKSALITVTCLCAMIGSLIAGFYANAPIGLAPGMGLNAFFTYTIVLNKGVPWETALGVVFVSGVFFFILSLAGIREKIAMAIPNEIKIASIAGIGLFITFIGLQNMGLVVESPATLVTLGSIDIKVFLGLLGLLIMTILEIKHVKGSILIGIIAITIISIFVGLTKVPPLDFTPNLDISPLFLKLDIIGALQLSLVSAIFSFMFVDLFDSLGTLIACQNQMKVEESEEEASKSLGKMLKSDVLATIIGSLFGTSTITTVSESGVGIASGGKTGLTGVVIGICFGLSIFFSPLIAIVPGYALAPALIIVGAHMFKSLSDSALDLHDFRVVLPVFVTVVLMPLTYSISIGLSFGFVSYILVHLLSGSDKKISKTLYFIGLLSLINLAIL